MLHSRVEPIHLYYHFLSLHCILRSITLMRLRSSNAPKVIERRTPENYCVTAMPYLTFFRQEKGVRQRATSLDKRKVLHDFSCIYLSYVGHCMRLIVVFRKERAMPDIDPLFRSALLLRWRKPVLVIVAVGILAFILWTLPNWREFWSHVSQFPSLWQIPTNRRIIIYLTIKIASPFLLMGITGMIFGFITSSNHPRVKREQMTFDLNKYNWVR